MFEVNLLGLDFLEDYFLLLQRSGITSELTFGKAVNIATYYGADGLANGSALPLDDITKHDVQQIPRQERDLFSAEISCCYL